MKPLPNYQTINKELWNKKAALHITSEFYNLPKFMAGHNSLKSIERNLLGDIRGKSVLHLQCHFGQDSISLARMGANVTGVDISDVAVEKARSFANDLDVDATFIESDVLELIGKIDKQFDIIFTSYGVVGWLPELNTWGKTIAHYLKPGGELIFVEGHPVMWMMDEVLEEVKYHYFNVEPILEKLESTYTGNQFESELESISWNHSLSEVISALLTNGLRIEDFQEFDYFPYPIFKDSKEQCPGQYRPHNHTKIPLTYSIKASKTS